ncbi:MAG: DNA polymerase III subunit alpha [Patescibacteria group bacterium]
MSRAGDFVHLHTHSHYSLLTALPQIDALVEAAKKDGQTALALTDNGSMYGTIDFYKECRKAGIKPIIGMDAFVAPRTRFDKEHRIDNQMSRLVLLAMNEVGYHNLIKLASLGNTEGFYYNARIDRELIERYKEGLIAILPSFAAESARHLKEQDEARAQESIEWYRAQFGEFLYAEVTHHPEIEGHEDRMKKWSAFARTHQVPLMAAHDTYYLAPEDSVARELVIKIKSGGHLDREMGVGAEDFSFITQSDAKDRFKDEPELLENTMRIADLCNLEIKLGAWFFPDFPVPAGSSHDTELKKLAYAGIEKRGLERTPEILARLDYELSVIATKGYSPYFLVVGDLLAHAEQAGIFTNTRGSAAGSLVSYVSGITTVNPLEFQLPFERFLNPDRPSPPDIDMDIADNRRDDLIDYARAKYGADHVAQVGTFGTMMARAAVRDVARALGHSYSVGDKIAKIIPFGKQGFPVTVDGALKEVAELREVYDTDPEAREVLDLAKKIEGNARHVGVHAAGVVIGPGPVDSYVPIQLDPKGGKTITQYDMHAVEDAGLLKFDFLGLKNLSVLADVVARVKKRRDIVVDVNRLPKNDPRTFEMLAKGDTLGVFQMASDGMTSYLVKLKPTQVDDLNVMVALYRPGPMDNIDEYIARKHGKAQVTYIHPKMKAYLDKTFGVLVYQDDLLMTAVELAGYSWGEVDRFRKAVGKKIPEEMAKQHVLFVEGCNKHSGMGKRDAEALWKLFEPFQGYGFNKAHAASYGNLSYQTAYMKATYPVDYMAALLTADSGDVEEVGKIVGECRRMGIQVLPPDVNESFTDFTVVDDARIRFGLQSIKNFGEGISNTIIETRTQGGPFTSLSDFLSRVTDRNLNKKSLEALIQTGGLDNLGERGALFAHIELLLSYHKEHANAPKNQNSLFGTEALLTTLKIPPAPPAPMPQKLTWEKELLGLYISGHPLDAHKEKLAKQKFDITQAKEKLPPDTQTVFAGIIDTKQEIITKSGEKMAFLSLADYGGAIEVVCFPRVLKEYGMLLNPGACILVKGRISPRNEEKSFVAEAIKPL